MVYLCRVRPLIESSYPIPWYKIKFSTPFLLPSQKNHEKTQDFARYRSQKHSSRNKNQFKLFDTVVKKTWYTRTTCTTGRVGYVRVHRQGKKSSCHQKPAPENQILHQKMVTSRNYIPTYRIMPNSEHTLISKHTVHNESEKKHSTSYLCHSR